MTTKTGELNSPSPAATLLERPLLRVNLEITAYIVLIVVSLVAHLWQLDVMAMHHDESIHAWNSWKFFAGGGGFTCAGDGKSSTYCYDPVYHGPALYILTFFSYFLFGDGEAQARLPMALAGVGMVASCWMLRPLIGKRGAFLAAILLGFSPSLLYFTRFARHDGLMVLWEVWMVFGIFRYLQSGRARFLCLTTAGIALAVGTHELYYILFFIFGLFVFVRLLAESPVARFLNIALVVLVVLCGIATVIFPSLSTRKFLVEMPALIGVALLLLWLCQRVWPRQSLLIPRMVDTVRNNLFSLWVALFIMFILYTVQYTTFFAYPRGFIDGLYAGIYYWLGSQHEYARGDQPWYYYLMQLPLYETLGVVCGIGGAIFLFGWGKGKHEPETGDENTLETEDMQEKAEAQKQAQVAALFPLFLVFWYFTSILLFSWAGEKMPWLLVHMALPGNLLAAWVLGKLAGVLDRPAEDTAEADNPSLPPLEAHHSPLLLLVPPGVLLLLVALGVALWRFRSQEGDGLAAQVHLLQGLVPLVVAGLLLFGLLTLAATITWQRLLALVALTLATATGAYMLRASWLAVYDHPDTPVELLVYTQTSPDVPRYVKDIELLAINLTRDSRSDKDVTGGLSLPIIVDSGNKDGDGSLAWPLQWYFRHFRNVSWKRAEDFQEPTTQTFEVELPGGGTDLAPVVMLYKSHINDAVRDTLSQDYVQPYGSEGALNWWFPEGDKCSPDSPGYKKFYYHSWMSSRLYTSAAPAGCGRDISAEIDPPWEPLLWSFRSENWETLTNFVLYRELAPSLRPGRRAMEVWVRKDLVSGVPERTAGRSGDMSPVHLMAQDSLGSADGLSGPTGITVDQNGNVYVADTMNHRVLIFDAKGTLRQTIGSFGNEEGKFQEPRGVAVDAQGNIYVADTWNARVVKLSPSGTWLTTWGTGNEDLGNGRRATVTGATQEGNNASPLGFFGPRGIAVDSEGHVYLADTGNRRIVVTDSNGTFLYQLGYEGSSPGTFKEPTGIGLDKDGNLYVADTWNGRVQVFPRGGDGKVAPVPIITWGVRGWREGTYDDPSLGVSQDGTVYVSIPTQQTISALTMRGDLLLRWGGSGSDLAGVDMPSGIAVGPDDAVYVVDRGNSRVLRFVLPLVRASLPAGIEAFERSNVRAFQCLSV